MRFRHVRTLIGMLALLVMTAVPAAATSSFAPPHTIRGRLTGEDGQPLSGATVRIVELGREGTIDENGDFALPGVPSGSYTVSFDILGYAPAVRRITVADADVTLNVSLKLSPIELPGVQVTATGSATSALESPQPTRIVGGEELREAQSASIGETLEGVPGVHSLSTGIGIGKPVIRGLTSNRVLILDDGQRLETQQWGDEHGPDIETADAERIEVIRGPASVLYGSDAIGGVINVVQPPLPDAIGRAPFVGGSLKGNFGSNNSGRDGTLSIFGASGGLGYRVSGTSRASESVRTPDYVLWNSSNSDNRASGQLGYRGGWGSIAGKFSYLDERIELTDEDPAETPFQRVAESRARTDLTLPLGASRLEATLGYERNRRREFEEAGATDVALGLLSNSYTGEGHFHHPQLGPLVGLLGLSAQHTKFEKFGEETLIPNTRADNIGVFAFEQSEFDRWNLSFGLRFDYRHLDVDDDVDIGVTAQTRDWSSLTGNVGVLYRVAEPVALVLNVGRGFRAPSTFDLFSNGVHEGTIAFERGDPTLKTEKSLNTDLAVRVQTYNALAEISGFVNVVQDYIFTIPTSEVDPESGFQIFDITQGDATLAGLEASLDYHPTDYLHLHGAADYVRGQNTTTDEPLPAMPPLRATYSVRLEGGARGPFQDAYLSFGGESNARQTRLDPSEAEFFAQAFDGAGFRSEAYTLLNLVGGFALVAAPGRTVRLDLQLRNLLNEAYADYLSRIKTNALNPGMGRSLIARVTTIF
jgi:iron complex outermembrane receptor protein